MYGHPKEDIVSLVMAVQMPSAKQLGVIYEAAEQHKEAISDHSRHEALHKIPMISSRKVVNDIGKGLSPL